MADAADVVLLATWSRAPLLALADTRAGQHLTSLGTDEPGSGNSPPTCWTRPSSSSTTGELAARTGVSAAPGLSRTAADATLTDICAAPTPAGPRAFSARCTPP